MGVPAAGPDPGRLLAPHHGRSTWHGHAGPRLDDATEPEPGPGLLGFDTCAAWPGVKAGVAGAVRCNQGDVISAPYEVGEVW